MLTNKALQLASNKTLFYIKINYCGKTRLVQHYTTDNSKIMGRYVRSYLQPVVACGRPGFRLQFNLLRLQVCGGRLFRSPGRGGRALRHLRDDRRTRAVPHRFLSQRSLRIGGAAMPDYDCARDRIRASFEARNGRQADDPERLANALVALVNAQQPPLRFLAGTAA